MQLLYKQTQRITHVIFCDPDERQKRYEMRVKTDGLQIWMATKVDGDEDDDMHFEWRISLMESVLETRIRPSQNLTYFGFLHGFNDFASNVSHFFASKTCEVCREAAQAGGKKNQCI